MPFTSSAPNFFGRFGAQTSPTNFGNPMDVFAKADATRSAMPNLFSTIQQVRANELERQTKQAAISTALQELVMKQQMAPYDMAIKQSEVAMAPASLAIKQAQAQTEAAKLQNLPQEREKLIAETQAATVKAQKDAQAMKNMQAFREQLKKDMDSGDLVVMGYTPDGKPMIRSKRYKQFEREMITENPTVDVDTQKALTAYSFLDENLSQVKNIVKTADKAFGDTPLSQIFNKYVVDKGNQFLVKEGSPYGDVLEDLVSLMNSARITGFNIAGAAYTGNERETVEANLNFTGKSSRRILKDLDNYQKYFELKAKAGLMGLKEARSIVNQPNKSQTASKPEDGMDDDAAYQEYLKMVGA